MALKPVSAFDEVATVLGGAVGAFLSGVKVPVIPIFSIH